MNKKIFDSKIAVYDKEMDRLKSLFKSNMSIIAKQILKNKIQEVKDSRHEFKTAVYEADRVENDSYEQMVADVKAKYGYNSWR